MEPFHFAELIYRQAEKYGTQTAIRYRNDKTAQWLNISWVGFAEYVRLTSQAMIEYGVGIQENIGVYSQNMQHCFFTDFGAYGVRAVPVPMYATSSPAQIEYIIRDAGIRLLFVGEQTQYNNAFKVQQAMNGALKSIVIFDPDVVRHAEDTTSVYFDEFLKSGDNDRAKADAETRRNQATPEDLAVIVYTSGTSGVSKGVILLHSTFIEAMRIHTIRLPMVSDRDVSICFLPLTHIFEKAWSCFCFHTGVQIAINRDPKKIQQILLEVRPTLMCNVPRFWEKVYTGAQEKINSFPGFVQKIFRDAVQTGRKYHLDYKRKGLQAPKGLALKFKLYDKTVFSLLKKAVGLERGRVFPIAGSALADNMAEFLISVNMPIKYGYGLSETTATVCFYPEVNYRIGSIGKIMPGVEVRIAPENSEILVKGKTVTVGYYNNPEETAKVFTEDGFFRTGDVGRMEGDTLFFLDRCKDLFKTSNGKYIAPQAIELSLSGNPYIEACAAIADNHKFVSALIIPAFPTLEAYAQKHGISYQDYPGLIEKDEIKSLYLSIIEECQKDFAYYEKIKRFTLLSQPFSMETGELTDTLKLRRSVIAKRYAEQIEAMYKED